MIKQISFVFSLVALSIFSVTGQAYSDSIDFSELSTEQIENYLANTQVIEAAKGGDRGKGNPNKGGGSKGKPNKGGKGGKGGGKGGGNNNKPSPATVVGTYTGTFLLTKQVENGDGGSCTHLPSLDDYQIIVAAKGKNVTGTVSRQFLHLPLVVSGTVDKKAFTLKASGGVIQRYEYKFAATKVTDTSANIQFEQKVVKRGGLRDFVDCISTYNGTFARVK